MDKSLIEHFRTDNGRDAALKACLMRDQRKDFSSKIDLEIEASVALEEARAMPRGCERAQALKKAGTLQNAALSECISFSKRGRPAKT